MIEELIKLDDHRNEYLQKQGLSLEKSSINAWLAEQHSGQSEVKILWDELLDLAKTAQQLNHSNGLIISTQLQHNQHAFSALHCAAGNVSCMAPKVKLIFEFLSNTQQLGFQLLYQDLLT